AARPGRPGTTRLIAAPHPGRGPVRASGAPPHRPGVRGRLLSLADRKNCWWLAEQAGHADPQAMQRVLRTAVWDAEVVRDDLRAFVAVRLGHAAGVLICDETGFEGTPLSRAPRAWWDIRRRRDGTGYGQGWPTTAESRDIAPPWQRWRRTPTSGCA